MDNKEIYQHLTSALHQADMSKQVVQSTGISENIPNVVAKYAKEINYGPRFEIHNHYPPSEDAKEIPATSSSVNTKEQVNNLNICNTDNSEEFAACIERLKNSHRTVHAHMKSFLWNDERWDFPLEDYYVDLKLHKTDKLGKNKGEIIDVNEIFKAEHRNILVTGNPGYGKTILCKKIAYDWASGSTKYLSHFDVVVVVTLRIYRGENIKKAVLDNTCICKNQKHKDKILSSKMNFLVILDGLDEIRDKKAIVQFIEEDCFEISTRMTILVTSRPHVAKEIRKYVDCRYTIGDLSLEQQQEYIKKLYQQKEEIKDVIFLYLNSDPNITSLTECPLMLHLFFCLLGSEMMKDVERNTEMYIIVIRLLVRRYVRKYGKRNPSVKMGKYFYGEDILIRLGKLLVEYCIINDDIISKSREAVIVRIILRKLNIDKHVNEEKYITFMKITDESLKQTFTTEELHFLLGMDILVQGNDEQGVIHFEIIHKTFEEFLISLYFAFDSVDISCKLSSSWFFTSFFLNPFKGFLNFFYGLCEYDAISEDFMRCYENIIIPVGHLLEIYNEIVCEEVKSVFCLRTKTLLCVNDDIDYKMISEFQQLYFIIKLDDKYGEVLKKWQEIYHTCRFRKSQRLKILIYLHIPKHCDEIYNYELKQVLYAVEIIKLLLTENDWEKFEIYFCGIYSPIVSIFSVYSLSTVNDIRDYIGTKYFMRFKNIQNPARISTEEKYKITDLNADFVALEFNSEHDNTKHSCIFITLDQYTSLEPYIQLYG